MTIVLYWTAEELNIFLTGWLRPKTEQKESEYWLHICQVTRNTTLCSQIPYHLEGDDMSLICSQLVSAAPMWAIKKKTVTAWTHILREHCIEKRVHWFDSPGWHVIVSLGSTDTETQTAPDVLVSTLRGSHRHQCVSAMYAWVTVSRFGKKCLLNVLNVNVKWKYTARHLCLFYHVCYILYRYMTRHENCSKMLVWSQYNDPQIAFRCICAENCA